MPTIGSSASSKNVRGQRPPVRAEDRCVRGQDAVPLRRDLQGLRPTTPTPCDTCNGVDRAARAVPRVGAMSRPPRPQARVDRVGALCGALCGALTSLWALATREGRFGRTSRWTMTEGTRGVCGLSRAQRTSRSCVRKARRHKLPSCATKSICALLNRARHERGRLHG